MVFCVRTSITLNISGILRLTNIGGDLMEQQLRKKANRRWTPMLGQPEGKISSKSAY